MGVIFGDPVAPFFRAFRERERALLSRNTQDPTVDGLRGEKEKRSTRSRLRMDSGLGSFFKLLEVGFSPYLGFIPIFSTFRMFRLIEALNGRLIGPKAWDRIDFIYGTQCEKPVTVRGCLGL